MNDTAREELREATLALLVKSRLALRPSEILHELSKDSRFLFWATCGHIAYQLHVLRRAGKVRKVYMPLGEPKRVGWRAISPGYRAWVVKGLPPAELRALRDVTLVTGRPLQAGDSEPTGCDLNNTTEVSE